MIVQTAAIYRFLAKIIAYCLFHVIIHRANKIQIKGAVEAMYGVNVKAVNTMKYVGKLKTRNTKAGAVSGRAATYKKAVITLKDGEVIDFYSGI